MSKFIKVHLNENQEKYINSDKVTEIRISNYGTYISMGETGYYVSETPEEILMMIDVDLTNECVVCGEYHDYHCEKWCTIIRQTIADLKDYYKDAIPIEDIQYYAEKAENPEIAEALLEVIYRYRDEQEKQNDKND